MHAAQEHARNLRAELTDSQASLNSLQQRQADERRRLHADYESRLRQNSATIDALNKELTQLRDQFSEEKNRLIETFNRQTSELTLQNQHLTEKIIELNSAMKKPNDIENHTTKEVNRTQVKFVSHAAQEFVPHAAQGKIFTGEILIPAWLCLAEKIHIPA